MSSPTAKVHISLVLEELLSIPQGEADTPVKSYDWKKECPYTYYIQYDMKL